AGRLSARLPRCFRAGCTVRRNPNAARMAANVFKRGFPRSDKVLYNVSRERPVLSASAAMPPTASATVRRAIGTARASPSSSIASIYGAISASFRRWSAALNGRLGATGFIVFPVRMCSLDVLHLCALVTAAQQQDQRLACLPVVHPITGTKIDSQLVDAFSNA